MNSWHINTIGKLMTFVPTGSHSRNDMTTASDKRENLVYNIHYGDIHTKYSTYVDFEQATVPVLKINDHRKTMLLQDGDVIMADASEDYKGVGASVELKNLGQKRVIGGLHTYAMRCDNDELAKGFAALLFQNPKVHRRLMQVSVYSKVYGLTKGSLTKVEIYYPEKTEQERIVRVLEVWDEYIEKLEQKIALKERLKKGLMQQLLTGKLRRCGYSDRWNEVRVGDLVDIKKGVGLSKGSLGDSGNKCVLYGEIYTFYDEIIDDVVSRTQVSNGIHSKKGDILIPASTTTSNLDVATATAIAEDNVLIGGDINILRPKQKVSSEFLAVLLSTTEKHNLAKRAQGVTIIHLYGKDMKKMKIRIPVVKEQQDIIDIYMHIRHELKKLIIKQTELKLQKKYLLKNLISGTIRTPENLTLKGESS